MKRRASTAATEKRITDQRGGQGPDPVNCLALISPLSSNSYLYALFDDCNYSNRDDAGLENESEKKKKKEEEEEEEEEESSLSAAQHTPTPGWEVSIYPEVGS